jgi:hypothetical protein
MMNINTKKYVEEFIKIRDKNSNIIDFQLNIPQQKLYDIIKKQKEMSKPVRVIILKARQMGFSTLTEAIIFKDTATKKNINSGIITHKEDATTNLFNMSKRMYDNLPAPLKPEIKNSNAKELIFDTKEGNGLGSKIKCMTAGSGGVGRSDTFNNLHISELAFWQGDKKETLTGLFQAVPNTPNSMVIIESTANGYEYFKELWDRANKGESDYVPLFVGWNELTEYQMPYNNFTLTKEEEQLKEIHNLTNEQLTWRRWCIANNCGGDELQFKQEYPINPHEAFLSTGNCVFNKDKIIERLEVIKKPLRTGYFSYDYDGLKLTNIKWNTDKDGYIKIYEVPNLKKYAIGGDTAGDGSDSFTAQVLDQDGNQVAVLKQKFDEDLYAKQMYCLGVYYNEALIGIESNFSTFPIKELERLGYKNQYIREKQDTYTGRLEKSFGFRTTSLTRPNIIAYLKQIVRENIECINDKETLEEMLTFITNEKGREEAQIGYHDDLVMGLAIAYEIKKQIHIIKQVIVPRPLFSFEKEDTRGQEDFGSTIEII